jgi:hypothetical protein
MVEFTWMPVIIKSLYSPSERINFSRPVFYDQDLYVIRSLNEFLKYELTLSWMGEDHEMGNQLFIAHKNARLLRTFADIYRYNYTSHVWYWNAGE